MSLKQTKELVVNQVSSAYGVTLSTSKLSCALVHSVVSIELIGDVANIALTTSVNGVLTGSKTMYSFTYNKALPDIVKQAESYLLTLPEFAAATAV